MVRIAPALQMIRAERDVPNPNANSRLEDEDVRFRFSVDVANENVAARCVLDDAQVPVARDSRINLATGVLLDPFAPIGPPGALVGCRLFEPFVSRWRQLFVRPIAVFVGGWRVDDTSDVA